MWHSGTLYMIKQTWTLSRIPPSNADQPSSLMYGQLARPDVFVFFVCVWLCMCDKHSTKQIETQCEVLTHSSSHDRACFTQQPSNCKDTNINSTFSFLFKEKLIERKSLRISQGACTSTEIQRFIPDTISAPYFSLQRVKHPVKVLRQMLLPPLGLSKETSPSRMWRCVIVMICHLCLKICPSPFCLKSPSALLGAQVQVQVTHFCSPASSIFTLFSHLFFF